MQMLKLLIVDDEPGIRWGIKRVLQNFTVGYSFMDEDIGFDTIEAESGELALQILEKEQIDIILLDNKLPGISGIEILDKLNTRSLDLAVMMITSYASLEVAVDATKKGAYNFVPKPFTPQELRSALENITKHLFLKRMTRKINESGKQIRFQFLTVLSHELKSPLNAIEGYLKIIKDKQAGDLVDNYQYMIDRSLARIKGMRGLILDLLDLTRIESGTKTRTIKRLDIVEVAQMSVDTMQPIAIQKNVNIKTNFPDKLIYNADQNEMEIIFNNLISNAIKYNRNKGTVTISITGDTKKACIKVEDTGIGMSDDESALLFQDFVRIKNEKTQNISGSGLGLSITKKLVTMYNGNITVSSKPDVGTTFHIELPYN